MVSEIDLLGDPIPEGRGKRGRPVHLATDRNRNKVMMLLALGWTNLRIANAIGITPPTLRKNYFPQLKCREVARDRLDGARLELLWDMAKSGNVGAAKEFGRMIDKSDQMNAENAFLGADEARTISTARLGKKEAAAQAAETAGEGSEWGDDLRIPGLVN